MGDSGEPVPDVEIEITDEGSTTTTTQPPEVSEESKGEAGPKGPKRERKDPEPCEKPDADAFQKAQDKIKSEINQVQAKIDEMTAKIEAACVTRQKHRDEAKSAQDLLTATTGQRKSISQAMQTSREEYDALAEARKQKRAEIEPMKQGLKFSSRAALEDAILKIEGRMSSANLSASLRAKYVDDITALKNQRHQTMRYEEQLNLIKSDIPEPVVNAKEEREAKMAHNENLFKESDAAHKKKKSAQEEAKKWNTVIEEQITKRKEIIDQKSAIQKRANDLTRAYTAQQRNYERYESFLQFKGREAKRAQIAAEREQRAAESKQRVALAKQRAEERANAAHNARSNVGPEEGEQTPTNWSGDGAFKGKNAPKSAPSFSSSSFSSAPAPIKRKNYDAQLSVISDLKRYLEFYKPKDVGRSDASTTTATPAVTQPRREFTENKSVTLLKKKNDIDDDWSKVIGTGKSKQHAAPKPKKVKDAPVNHIPDALAKFKFVDVNPPLLTSQIDGVLKALDEKRQYFEELPDKEVEEMERKLAQEAEKGEDTKEQGEGKKQQEELEEGEIEDEGDEEEEEAAAEPSEDLSAQQIKAVAVTKEVLTSDAVEDLTTAFAAATIQQVNAMADAIAEADDKKTAAPEEGEGEEMTPEQAAAMAAMAGELEEVVGEAQAGLGDWVPPVAEKKPEHKDESQIADTHEVKQSKVEEPQRGEKHAPKSADVAPTEDEAEGEEELTPEQAAAMAAMADELGEVVEEAQAGLGDWTPPVAEKKPDHKDEKPAEQHKEHKSVEHNPEETKAATTSAAGEEEELTPEQAAAMAAMNDELGFVVEEAQAGLGDWAPAVAERRKSEKHEVPVALAEITQQTQDAVLSAVTKALEEVSAHTPATVPTTVAAVQAQVEAEEEEGDEGDAEAEEPVTIKVASPVAEEVVEEYYEEVEIEEGDEEEGDIEESEVAQQ